MMAANGLIIGCRARRNDPQPLELGGYRYDRVVDLADGKVSLAGYATRFREGKIGDLNTEIFHGSQTLDVTEIGLHPFVLAYANEGFRDYVLLPIFPLRVFRHKSIFIRTDRGIDSPKDLKGKVIATPGYSSTSLTWIRGMLQDEYGITPGDVEWIVSSKDSGANLGGKTSAQEMVLPDGLRVRSGTPGLDESELLMSGEADALFHAVEPAAYVAGDPLVARLFSDSRAVEHAYFEKTGIFPIMHVVCIRRTLADEQPRLVRAVFDAYSEAKQRSYKRMTRLGWAYDALPWYGQELESTKGLMGKNFYSYGIPDNRKTVDTLLRYSFEQGLAERRLKLEELFHPASLEFEETIA